jgi:1,4-dihydroxy-2-naphthoate octaprenyltransferase
VLKDHFAGWWKVAMIARLGRPKFLLGGIALFVLGTLLAERTTGQVDWVAYAWGQLAVLSIQLMTHYSNDYFDYHADLANPNPTPWSGGSRVLVEGKLERAVALKAALVAALFAVVCSIGLLLARPAAWPGVVLLGGMLLLAWSYSAPPLRLHNRGLGEPTVWLVVPIATPLAGFLLQTHVPAILPVLLVLPLSFLLLAMLLTLELPDELGDQRVGKLSWTVLWGARRVAQICVLLTVAALAARFGSGALGVPESLMKGWLWLIPLVLLQLRRLWAGDWKRKKVWSRLELGAVALFFCALMLDLVSLYRAPRVGVPTEASTMSFSVDALERKLRRSPGPERARAALRQYGTRAVRR